MRFLRSGRWFRPVYGIRSNEILAEESTLFVSILKWSLLAGSVGAIVGGATTIFLHLLDFFINLGYSLLDRPYLLLPLVMPLVVLIVRKLAPQAKGHGTEKVIEAIHMYDGAIKIAVVPVKLVTTLLTLGAGGSVGKEGPCAQIGGSLSYLFSKLLGLNRKDVRKLVICGISAGFAAVFGTPISGAIFGAEVLYLGLLEYDVLFPCLVAGVVAHIVCPTGHPVPAFPMPEVIQRSHVESALIALGAGLVFGLVALLVIVVSRWVEVSAEKWNINTELRAAIGGILLIGILSISPRSAGLSTDTIEAAFVAGTLPLATFWWKTLATSVTLGFGGSGGIITPLFVIGATAGFALAKLMHLPAALLAAFGMVAVTSAATNTPIATSVMALELFGPQIGTYAAIASLTAYLLVGHRSVYPSQLLGAPKSSSILISDLDHRIDSLHNIDIKTRRRSVLYMLGKLRRKPSKRPTKAEEKSHAK